MRLKKAHVLALTTTIFSVAFTSCSSDRSNNSTADVENSLVPITFQSDWFAQPEYAGFYQALATGLYEKHGLDVTIVEGGPNADPIKRLLLKRCDVMNIRADEAIVTYSRDMPVRFIGVTMQHNPQGILSHQEHAISDFKQLNGKRVMVDVAAPWIDFIEKKYDITLIRMPHNFGLSHFLNDKEFIMQCFVTNEPYYVRKNGANPHVLPLWECGLDSYRGMLVHADFWEENQEAALAFVRATTEAWHDYLYNDPTPAHALISSRNDRMTEDFMNYIREQIIAYGIVDGKPNSPSNIGKTNLELLKRSAQTLLDLGVIEKNVEISELFPNVPDSDLHSN